MIINCSSRIIKKYGIDINEGGITHYLVHPLLIWRWDMLNLSKRCAHLLAVNEATMFSFLIPLKNSRSLDRPLLGFVSRLESVFREHGRSFDSKNLNILFSKNNDRSLLGSVTNLKELYDGYHEYMRLDGVEIKLSELETKANQIPFKAIGYGFPEDKFRELMEQC